MADGDPISVLVIDDDQDIRETLSEVIEAEGFSVVAVANGGEALDRLIGGLRPGLIVLDLMMPVMSGWELLTAIRGDAAFADIPIAIISASGGRPPPAPGSTMLKKPIDLDALIELVQRCCAHRQSGRWCLRRGAGSASFA